MPPSPGEMQAAVPPSSENASRCPPVPCLRGLVDVDALGRQLVPSLLDFQHQLLVRLGYIVEGEDTQSQLEQKVCAEGNEGPERKLLQRELLAIDLGVLKQGRGPVAKQLGNARQG